jgi:hypothetical protein
MIKWIAASSVIHTIFIFGYINNVQVVKPDPEKFKGNIKTEQTLTISFLKTPIDNTQTVKGFKKSEGEQAETFLPDDTCPWDGKEQKKRWEQYKKEQEELRQKMLKEQEEGFEI